MSHATPASLPAPASGPPDTLESTKPRFQVVLTGNPNCGKTTLFNALTGLRAKVGNYAGVTVERKEGRLKNTPARLTIQILDLPGTYSLSPQSLDEQIARDVLFHRVPDVPPPSLVVVVVDASNLERNLYFATQVLELGYPTLVALNMVDVAEQNGHDVHSRKLADLLGVPVIPLVASRGEGVHHLREHLIQAAQNQMAPRDGIRSPSLPPPLRGEVQQLAGSIRSQTPRNQILPEAEALLLLTDDRAWTGVPSSYRSLIEEVQRARERLERAGVDWRSAAIEARYARAAEIHSHAVSERTADAGTFSDRLDRLLTHRIWGVGAFVVIMALMFQSIFSFAELPMNAIESLVSALGGWVGSLLPPGDLNSLLVDGMIAGVGSVIVFLPQILLLFLFIGLLEDTGYMARAAFLMDRLMSRVGLHGKSFIPLLSSFACAIPGIMATRTIESPKDRLATILVAPLMSCSARLPVYTLLIAACIPDRRLAGLFGLQGLTMLGMYLLGTVVALLMAWLFKRTLLKGEPPLLIMELPPYRRPVLRVVVRHMWDRSKLFLQRAGTVILAASIVLWFLASYPKNAQVTAKYSQLRAAIAAVEANQADASPAVQATLAAQKADLESQEASEQLRSSFAGRLGRAIEPLIAPLGYDWQIGIGIVASFAAREVFVSTMSTVYSVSEDESTEGTRELATTLRSQRRSDGSPVFTLATGLSLMVFYVFALQCVSTVAVVRRETNTWHWPVFQWVYMGVLAWVGAFITWRVVGYLAQG